jgi:hypothetical protein
MEQVASLAAELVRVMETEHARGILLSNYQRMATGLLSDFDRSRATNKPTA